MSGEMRPYVVRQGDYLVKLGWVHGFDPEEVWNDPKNEELKKLRGDHNILAPGDVVYLPVKEREGLPIVKGAENKYVAKVPRVRVSLVLLQEGPTGEREPMKGEKYLVEGQESSGERSVGDGGEVTLDIPAHVSEVTLILPEKQLRYLVRVGHMDPLREDSGALSRLSHLGYLGHTATGELSAAAPTEEEARDAILSFQAAHGCPTTGVVDDATRRALEEAHRA